MIQPLWDTEGVVPDISVLLSCTPDNYKCQIRNRIDKRKKFEHHGYYLAIDREHYGTRNHHVVNIDGKNGQLYAAGTIKSLILLELKR